MPGALAVFSPDGTSFLQSSALVEPAKVNFGLRGAWLLQEASYACDPTKDFCSMESTKVIILLITLSSTIVLVICAFTFFREDREEQITPLCPQLIVKDHELNFKIPLGTRANDMDVVDTKDPPDTVCKVSMDWPDPFRGSPHGVAATVRIHNRDLTLATVVARNVAVLGQGLALCRSGCEIFGFVEPDGPRYLVRHRTGVLLLTLIGDFDNWDIEGVNPVGSKVCKMEKRGVDECVGSVCQHVDAGLVICALMATHVHRRLSGSVPPPWASSMESSAPSRENSAPVPGGAPQFSGEPALAVATAPNAQVDSTSREMTPRVSREASQLEPDTTVQPPVAPEAAKRLMTPPPAA
jgi:hypothetical protein